MLRQFTTHCDPNTLQLDYQSVYRINISCETALAKLQNAILWSMEEKNVSQPLLPSI